MCLAVPGEVEAIEGEALERTGRVRFGGAIRTVSLALLPEAQVGDYVIVHVGVALRVLDEQPAADTLAALDEAWDIEQGGGS